MRKKSFFFFFLWDRCDYAYFLVVIQVRTEWASNLACKSQQGCTHQFCFPILQRWKWMTHWTWTQEKIKINGYKRKKCILKSWNTCMGLSCPKDAKWTSACWELKCRCQPSYCLQVHCENSRLSHSGSGVQFCQHGKCPSPTVSPPASSAEQRQEWGKEFTALPERWHKLVLGISLLPSLLDQYSTIKHHGFTVTIVNPEILHFHPQ